MRLTGKWYHAPKSVYEDPEAYKEMHKLYRPFDIAIYPTEVEFFAFFGKRGSGEVHIVFSKSTGDFKKIYGASSLKGDPAMVKTEASLKACNGVATFIYNMMANGYLE